MVEQFQEPSPPSHPESIPKPAHDAPPPPAQGTNIKAAFTSEISQKSFPSLNPQKLLLLFLPLLIITLIIAGFLFYVSDRKKTLQTAVQNQVSHFHQLTQTYQDIVNLIRENEQEPENQLLRVQLNLGLNPEKVLGLEESPAIIQMRKLNRLYNQAKEVSLQIESQNQTVQNQISSFPLNLSLRPQLDLTSQTAEFAQATHGLFTYLKAVNSLEIEATTLGFEFGVALEAALASGLDPSLIQKMEDLIAGIDDLKQKFLEIDASHLSADLQKDRLDELDEFEKSKTYFEEIVLSFKSQDPEAILQSLESLIIDAGVATEKSKVETVTFWQEDPTLNAAPKLQKDWQAFLNQI